MSQQYPMEQISFNLDRILQEVEQGEPIQISWQGKQVAVMLSASKYERLLNKQVGFWKSVEKLRQEYQVEKADIDPDQIEYIPVLQDSF
jgi:prevent-host-death family protein